MLSLATTSAGISYAHIARHVGCIALPGRGAMTSQCVSIGHHHRVLPPRAEVASRDAVCTRCVLAGRFSTRFATKCVQSTLIVAGMSQAPRRRPLPPFLANIGIVVPVAAEEPEIEEGVDDEDDSSDISSVATVDSSVVSETDSDDSAAALHPASDFSEAWIQAIDAATDVSEERLRSLLLLLRTQRNHLSPSIPPPTPPPVASRGRRGQRARGQQAPAIGMRNAFQALAISDQESDEEDEFRADLPVASPASSVSTRVQCRYLKVMIKVNISDVRRRNAQALFEQKRWQGAADLFETAHGQLHLVMVRLLLGHLYNIFLRPGFTRFLQERHDDWWALALQFADAPSAPIATSHDVVFLSQKLWLDLCLHLCPHPHPLTMLCPLLPFFLPALRAQVVLQHCSRRSRTRQDPRHSQNANSPRSCDREARAAH